MSEFYINDPKDIKNKSNEELVKIASDIREFLINENSQTGGHLGSNLGVVELTMALHKNFNSPTDKLIFDVGHQCYVHKILTGRANQFDTLRQHKGLSGFVKIKESEHDVWEAGHSSTSISAASGFAFARDLNKGDEHIIALIGDGSMTNGMSIEALNHISSMNQRVIIILNDNEMSISKNVGFIDDILKNLQYSQEYVTTKRRVRKTLSYVPFGKYLSFKISRTKAKVKQKINASENFFNLMGFEYYGPIDGHDFNKLDKALKHAKQHDGPIILHVKTEKGRGYEPARIGKWHGVGPFDVATGELKSKKTGVSYSKLVANKLEALMKNDEDIVVITPAMAGGSELEELEANYPDRFTDVGIAEEHAITFAGALALGGKKPFVSIYSTFLQRSYDQVFHDLVRQNTNVVIGIDRAGLVGEDGETHQGIYDISFLSHMHNMTIVQGKDEVETMQLLKQGFDHIGPYAIRYSRGGNFENVDYNSNEKIPFGTWDIVKEGSKYIISYGPMVNRLLELFKDSKDIGIINARYIKPLDESMLMDLKDNNLYVVEEHTRLGGLGTLISNFYNEFGIKKVIGSSSLGDKFIEQGNVELLLQENHLVGNDLKNIIEGYFNEQN